MESEKQKVIQMLIEVFAKDFPRRNHIIVVDMTTGSYRVDEMLAQKINKETAEPQSTLPDNWQEV